MPTQIFAPAVNLKGLDYVERVEFSAVSSTMFDYKIIVRKIDEVLNHLSNVLTETQINSISSLNHAGEWHLSLEILCENLYEDELPISKQAYELLEEIGSTIKVEKDYWQVLKPQIKPDS